MVMSPADWIKKNSPNHPGLLQLAHGPQGPFGERRKNSSNWRHNASQIVGGGHVGNHNVHKHPYEQQTGIIGLKNVESVLSRMHPPRLSTQPSTLPLEVRRLSPATEKPS